MYHKILIPLENSKADAAILHHIKPLAKMMGASLLLMHVADGWVARNYERLNLAESEEMKQDRAYLQHIAKELESEGFTVSHVLARGEPSDEIIKFTRKHHVDLIAMSTHGHRFISDILYGSTADKVRHLVDVPVLLLKAPR
ncbi:MAG TPA: universal stress protein [Candidatus Methylacidiphilales bacterium]|jgi:nucleotide-binding universal stress UspA family protein|nr:universal stress protein [Candidatus Methylacidiphilales bacterium]